MFWRVNAGIVRNGKTWYSNANAHANSPSSGRILDSLPTDAQGIAAGSLGQLAAKAVQGVPLMAILLSLSGTYKSGSNPCTLAQDQNNRRQ